MARPRERVRLEDGLKLDLNGLIYQKLVRPGSKTGTGIRWSYRYLDEEITTGKITADMTYARYSLFSENGAFDQLGRKFFDQYYTAPYSDDYRKVLDVMSEHFDDWVNRATIIKESSLKSGTVDNALRALKAKKIVNQHESRRGEYRLPTRSFAVWIKAKRTAAVARRPAEPGLFEG